MLRNLVIRHRAPRRHLHALPGLCLALLALTAPSLAQTSQSYQSGQSNSEPSSAQMSSPGAAATPQPSPAGSTLPIVAGDLVSIDVFNTPELSGKFRVSQGGEIALPQGGVVHVGGLSTIDAGREIETRLRDGGIMLDPHVTVFVQEYASQGVIVLGEVNHPGTYTLLGEHSLYGALAAAGGPTGNEGSTIVVTHEADPDHKQVIQVNSPNFSDAERLTRVNPGDTVFVSRGDMVYVLGEVAHPGAFPIRSGQPLNVLELLSLAQGVEHTSASSKAMILRQNAGGGANTVIPIDLKQLTKHGAPDPILQGSDILIVPRDGVKAVLYTALPATTSAVVSALIYSSLAR